MNAFVERWIQSLKHEALNHFIVFGLAHFDYIVRVYVTYYHECRPQQGISSWLIGTTEDKESPSVPSSEDILCETKLGGLLRSYRRAA